MRIGMVTACYKPVMNGVTRMVALYKHHLEQLGHEVIVFTLGKPDPAGDEPGVIRSPGLPIGQTGYYFGVRYTSEAQAFLAGMDVLHCHHLFMSIELAHRYAHCPIVYTNHTRYDLYAAAYVHLSPHTAELILRQVWPTMANLGDTVIAPSPSVKQVLEQYGVRSPIVVIPNGIPLDTFVHPARPHRKSDLGLSPNTILLAFVGRLAAEKNIAVLLEQFQLIQHQGQARGQDVHLMLIGDGPLRRKLPDWLAEKHLTRAVHFVGAVTYEEVPDWLAAADLFITASVSEVHPLTVIEAMAAGLPVVGVTSPGIADTVQSGVNGCLVEQPEQLAAAVLPLIADATERKRLGAAARATSLQYDIRHTVAATVALYEQLQQRRSRRSGLLDIRAG